MISIYFDNVLVDDDDYLEIKNDYKMFDSQFYLGATPCNSFSIKVPNTYDVPSEVKIQMDNVDYATLIVDSYSIDDNNLLCLKLVDKMVLFDKEYDASGIVPCTTADILDDICDTFGVTLGTNSFVNDDVTVDFYDNTYTARAYISFIAELNGGYAQIGADGKLYLRQFDNQPIEIDVDTCEEFKIGEKRTVERVVYDNGLVKYETSNDDTLETLYLNSENVYINSQEIFDNIADEILNFEFYNFSTGNCEVNYNATCGKLIEFVDGENTYVSISQYDHEYNGGWLGGYELDLDSVFQNETKIKGNDDKIKAIKITQDRLQNQIDITVEEVDANNNQIVDLQISQSQISSSVSSLSQTTSEQYGDLLSQFNDYVEINDDAIDQINDKFNDYATSGDLNAIARSVNEVTTDTYKKIEINTMLSDGSVKKLQTASMLVDDEGLTFEKTNAKAKTNINENGLTILDNNDEPILKAVYDNDIGNTVVETYRHQVKEYFIMGQHSRFEDYENGTGCFFI